MTDQRSDAILLADTDLELAFDGQDPGFPGVEALVAQVGSKT